MLWKVEERKPATARRRAVVDCLDDDLDCLIAGIHSDANLHISKIYFVSVTIAGADDGVGHVSNSPGFQRLGAENYNATRINATNTISSRIIFMVWFPAFPRNGNCRTISIQAALCWAILRWRTRKEGQG